MKKADWEAHPALAFDALYERREYAVMAAFYSRVYGEGEEGVFAYYRYTDLTDSNVFAEYVAAAIYDTGVTARYDIELITLSACNDHTDDGRFVVVAKRSK